MDISFWRKRPKQQPFLSPLTPGSGLPKIMRLMTRHLPAIAIPFAAMLAGTVALVVLFNALSNGEDKIAMLPQEVAVGQETAAAPEASQPPRLISRDIAVRTAEELPGTDPSATGSILQALPEPAAFVPVVPVAETEEEIADLEAMQRGETTAPPPQPETPGMRDATTTQAVNLRAGPNDEAEVLTVVPAKAAITAEDGCNHWCAASYDGRSGYIYKNFIGYR